MDEITSGPFIIVVTDGFPVLRISAFFQNAFALVAGNFECDKGFATMFLMIEGIKMGYYRLKT